MFVHSCCSHAQVFGKTLLHSSPFLITIPGEDLSFFEYLSPFCFCRLNFIVLFPFLIKYYHLLFIITVFWLGCDFSILMPLFLPPSSVSVSYFIVSVPMRECLGKHSCMSSPFPIGILNGNFFFSLCEGNE